MNNKQYRKLNSAAYMWFEIGVVCFKQNEFRRHIKKRLRRIERKKLNREVMKYEREANR